MMTVMTMMIRMRLVMKTLIVASFALPMLYNVTVETHIRTRKRCLMRRVMMMMTTIIMIV